MTQLHLFLLKRPFPPFPGRYFFFFCGAQKICEKVKDLTLLRFFFSFLFVSWDLAS